MPHTERKTSLLRRRPLAAALAMLGYATPMAAQAEDAPAKVVFSIGQVTVVNADGQRRTANRGEEIYTGESIVTERGRVHLRFSDGGKVSLKPNTEFKVDEYSFNKDQPTESRSFFNLVRGGLRAVSGLIGRSDRRDYRVRTSVATIGIRGTVFEAELGSSITVRVFEGAIELLDDSGVLIRVVEQGEEITYDEITGKVTIGGQDVRIPDEETANRLGLPLDAASSEDVDDLGRSSVLGYE